MHRKKVAIIISILAAIIVIVAAVFLLKKNLPGNLEINSEPSQAVLYIDTVKYTTPYLGSVKPGNHKIFISKEGYLSIEKDIEVERNKKLELDFVLEEDKGYLLPEGDAGY
ncbi:MAG TPA: PEGA domain-containing protein [Flavobacterium sp.]|nr:PEGA domain-containing protein [Flavobacterium sp.]